MEMTLFIVFVILGLSLILSSLFAKTDYIKRYFVVLGWAFVVAGIIFSLGSMTSL